MSNHVHLLISPGSDAAAVSSFMRLLAARQTRYFNRKTQRSGTLWEGRFKASLVDTSNYLPAWKNRSADVPAHCLLPDPGGKENRENEPDTF